MNLFALSGLLTAINSFAFGIFSWVKGKKFLNKIWAIFNLAVAIWGIGAYKFSTTLDQKSVFFWLRFGHIGVILIPIFFIHFVFEFLEIRKKKIIFATYVIGLILFVLNITDWIGITKVFIVSLRYVFNTFYVDSPPGPLYPLFVFFFFGVVIYAHYLGIKHFKVTTGLKRMQIKYFLLATALGFGGGGTAFLMVFKIDAYPLLHFTVSLYPIIMTYAIFRYHLMDINIALTRAGIFTVVYTLVLGIPFWIGFKFLGRGLWIIPVSVTALLATLGPFIYLYLNRKAEDRLLKEQRRYQNTLKQASVGMTRIRNLRRLLDLITHIVTKTVKISYAAIYLYDKETNEFLLQVARDKGRMSLPKLPSDNPLLSWLKDKREPLVYEEIRRLREDSSDITYRLLEENMRLLTATVVVPSFLEDRFMAFFVLGEKLSGQIYTPDDLEVFQILASQSALAIENARFFEETKQMQEQIAQAEKMATVGTMADGLSHQINNRFYCLALIAGDTVDTIKLTDTSKCSPEVKEMLNQINHALERIKENVIQGGQVVKGILKYTRKGEEGFEPLSLDQILDSTLAMVQYKVKLSEIDIIRNYPKDHPKLKGNLVQLQEPFFNFIDNAYDAIMERKEVLKETGYRGRLTFSVQSQQENAMLLITVEDNGLGIKEECKKKLFTPFFTTKVSSRQGTGLGLYVIKRIIEEFHKGKIWFESEYGKGTKFFVQLPIS